MMSSLHYNNEALSTFTTSFHHPLGMDSPSTMDTINFKDEQGFIYEYLLRTSFHSIFLKFGRLVKENLHDENLLIGEIQAILSNCRITVDEFIKLFNLMINFYQNYNQYLNQNGNDGKFSIKILIVYLLHKFVKNLNVNHSVLSVVYHRMDALDNFVLNFIKMTEAELSYQNDNVLQKFKSLLYQNFQVV